MEDISDLFHHHHHHPDKIRIRWHKHHHHDDPNPSPYPPWFPDGAPESELEEHHMPVTLNVGETVIGTPVETAAGVPVTTIVANITWASSNPAVASFVTNPDGTATFTGVGSGSTTVTVDDTVANISTSDTITVPTQPPPPPPTPDAITIQWGTPVTPASAKK